MKMNHKCIIFKNQRSIQVFVSNVLPDVNGRYKIYRNKSASGKMTTAVR